MDLRQAVESTEDLQLDLTLSAVDNYRLAINHAKDRHIEVEAEALSSLGRIYHTILHRDTDPAAMFDLSVRLAASLYPRVVTTTPWYEAATSFLRSWQQHKAAAFDKQCEQENARYHQELKDALEELDKQAKKGAATLLKHLYDKHPPKDPAHVMGPIESSSVLRKSVLRAIRHYHTDHKPAGEDDVTKKWVYLCEQIVIRLNRVHEPFKNVYTTPERVTQPTALNRRYERYEGGPQDNRGRGRGRQRRLGLIE